MVGRRISSPAGPPTGRLSRRRGGRPAAARPTPGGDQKAQLDRIGELSGLARTTWFGLLAYLGFVGITLLGVQDADFFVPSRQTQLPLVGVQIPTASFFWFAPILGAALYAYLHLQLVKLWDALAAAPATVDGEPMAERVYPWLVNDLGLSLRRDGAARPRPLGWLSGFVTRALVWFAAPLVLIGFWWRSMPAHDEWMTLLIAACLLLALYVGFTSWWAAVARLRGTGRPPWAGRWKRPLGWLAVLLVVAVSWLRTEGGIDHAINRVVDTVDATLGTGLLKDCSVGGEKQVARGEFHPDCVHDNGDAKAQADVQEARVADLQLVWTLDDLTYRANHWLLGRWIDDETWTPLAPADLSGEALGPPTGAIATRRSPGSAASGAGIAISSRRCAAISATTPTCPKPPK